MSRSKLSSGKEQPTTACRVNISEGSSLARGREDAPNDGEQIRAGAVAADGE